ncbi:MAG: alanine/glycine:cation symporter family protein [Bacteroidales bacterium]|nr:alanine/glycine:cation symporter family protein [Bacteroidales bacterium]
MFDELTGIFAGIAAVCSDYVLVPVLLLTAIYFTVLLRGVQFTMAGEMVRLLIRSGRRSHGISSFQAFAVSIASRVGTGNLAGVASAIAIGGPGAVFWMWCIALLGAASAFVESTLAQLFKIRGRQSYVGGPAYYILKGLGQRWWAVTFAVLITVTFGLAFNSVQSNTIAEAMANSFGVGRGITAIVVAVLSLFIICGGIRRISRISEIIVPVMAVGYLILAVTVIILNIHRVPEVVTLIFENAFGFNEVMGGTFGSALIMGVKRGLFSNEAGEGSTPNAAATATVSHPVKQGLIQALGVYTDTLIICSCTAFIILCSGLYIEGHNGIQLTQHAIDAGLHDGAGSLGSTFVCIAIFFFAFTSIIANYYYGEANLRFIRDNDRLINIYRLIVGVMVYAGGVASLDLVWGFADITMSLMTICNIAAILAMGRYAVILLRDYTDQRRRGLDPQYRGSTIPGIADRTECW